MEYNKELLRKLKENYFTSKALYKVTKEQAEEIDRKILLEYEFYESKEIAEKKKSRGGIADPRGKDYIPEAEEKALYHEAEQQLIDYAIDIIPDFLNEKETLKKYSQVTKYREQILNIILMLEC